MNTNSRDVTAQAMVVSLEAAHMGDAERSIADWLVKYLADLLAMPPDQVDPAISFERYGLDSSAAVGLSGDLGYWIGCNVDPAATYDHPTINALAKALSNDRLVLAAFEKSARARHAAVGALNE